MSEREKERMGTEKGERERVKTGRAGGVANYIYIADADIAKS